MTIEFAPAGVEGAWTYPVRGVLLAALGLFFAAAGAIVPAVLCVAALSSLRAHWRHEVQR